MAILFEIGHKGWVTWCLQENPVSDKKTLFNLNRQQVKDFTRELNAGMVPTNNDVLFTFKPNEVLLVHETGGRFRFPEYRDFEKYNIKIDQSDYLGKNGKQNFFNIFLNDNNSLPNPFIYENIRSLFSIFNFEQFQLAGYAYHLYHWEMNTRYCGRCGTKTERAKNEKAKTCPSCQHISYPKISPAIIVAIIKDDKILLARNNRFRNNMYSILAGFVDPGESLEDCLHREVMEEVNIEVKNIRYFDSQPWPFPDSIMIGFFADYKSGEIKVNDEELTDAGWFDPAGLPELPAPYSIARRMIDSFVTGIKK